MSTTESQPEPSLRPIWNRALLERIAVASLVGLVGYFLQISWRRWPDLQIDFGRELYVPWRLSQGDVLGRDVSSPFGPLSQYFNAGLFWLFGPGLMVLVVANLAIYSAILVTAYRLLRRGWGLMGAWAGCAAFVTVFSFAQYIGTGNYNYATPYAHEATHGFLVCLLLAATLTRYLREPGLGQAAIAGGLFGLTALLKIEFVVAGVVVVVTAIALQFHRHAGAVSQRDAAGFAISAALPTLLFTVFFARHLPWAQALRVSGKGWLTVFLDDRFGSELDQRIFLGTDQPLLNFQRGATAAIAGLSLVGGIIAGAALVGALGRSRLPRWLACAAAVVLGALSFVAGSSLSWIDAGQGLLGLTVVAWLLSVRQHGRDPAARPETTVRILVGALAIALLFRMLLNVRLYHYGFVQAALAAIVVTATVVSVWPRQFLVDRLARSTASVCLLALLTAACIQMHSASVMFLRAKTYAIGSKQDFFYGFERSDHGNVELFTAEDVTRLPARPKEGAIFQSRAMNQKEARLFEVYVAMQNAKGIWLNDTLRYLERTAPTETVLVLPEGVMINYLARRRSPLAATKFFGHELAAGGEARLVEELQSHRPGHVVIFSRDLRDNGIARYGTKVGEGRSLLQWIAGNYTLVAQSGIDPLDSERQGVALYRAKSASTP